MDIECLRAVYAAYKYGSYFEAAYQLSMDYSVLSKKISRVENEFGIKIFKRALRGHPLSLTNEGIAIMSHIQKNVLDYDALKRRVNEVQKTKQKVLRIGYWRSSGAFDETELIAGFFSDHSDYQLNRMISDQDDLYAALSSGKLDCIFISDMSKTIEMVSKEDFFVVPLSVLDSMHLLINRDDPLASCSELKKEYFSELKGASFIFDSRQSKDAPNMILDFLGIKDDVHKVFVDYTDMAVAYSLVRQGKGIMPSFKNVNITDDRIRVIRVEGWKAKCSLYLVYPKGKMKSGLREFVLETLDYYGNKIAAGKEDC